MKPQANDTTANRRAGKVRNGKQPPRRVYSLEYKLQVLEQCRAKGTSIAEVARRHNMNDNVIFRWRQEERQGKLGPLSASRKTPPVTQELLPLGVIGDDGALVKALPAPCPPSLAGLREKLGKAKQDFTLKEKEIGGRIELELPGNIRMIFDAGIDQKTLSNLLAAVRGAA